MKKQPKQISSIEIIKSIVSALYTGFIQGGGLFVKPFSPKHIIKKMKLVDLVMEANLSIRSKIIIAFIVIILLMVIMNVVMLYNSLKYSERYNVIVSNITTANSINGIVKTRIDSEMWDIVAGKIKFEDGKQYSIINEINQNIRGIVENVSTDENRTRLDVTLRTIDTLKRYIDQIGQQIEERRPVSENEAVLDEIRGVSSLVEDNIQKFILYEIQSTEKIGNEIRKSYHSWMIMNVAVFGIGLLFSSVAAWVISESISKPIREIHNMTKSIAAGNLNVRVENKNVDEIAALGMSFNIMTQKIKELLERSIKEQENLKKSELKVLQAQINPHFLYNTLDNIVWMAEANKSKEVIKIVRALSSFFRITLSKGKDWIPISDEVAHIRSYLIIQKIRYRDILDFQIDVDESILEYNILKLTLQPLVENALYHGIKNKREGGVITVKGYVAEKGNVIFEINDNGAGMTPERLAEIQKTLDSNTVGFMIKESGFGLNNVHKRIKLYYGNQYGLKIQSEFKKGTQVAVLIPMER
ncbi:two-component system sensor histidine kinase YesM [Anaerobacterium chartisolvens]|uniref:Two-component system sensor histidine kinase YesM n=1 Tax=Anaerobacterium chartisolvens TaxID=1297424 RepID=A0A369BAX9_9FIRM|nr:two-component system sensor histidine kinase YesM [Anaerobacterium chartisolvens]